MFIIPILIALGFLAFLVLSLVLMGLHRAGKLKRFRHIHLFGAVVLVTVAAMSVAEFSVKYDLSHFVLTQPGTIWSTDDGSIVLEVSDTLSGPTDWYEYDMRMLVDGEYREVELAPMGTITRRSTSAPRMWTDVPSRSRAVPGTWPGAASSLSMTATEK